MTNTNAVPNDTPVTPPAATPDYSDAAAQALTALDTIAALIPTSPQKQGAPISYVRRRQAVNPELIDRAVDTVEATPSLQSLLDLAQTRDSVAFNDAFRPVLSRINAMGQDLRLEINLRHAKAGEDALAVYATAKRLAARPGGAELASHVAAMKPVARSPKAARKRKKATTEPPVAASPTPSAPSAPTAQAEPPAAKQS